MAGLSPFMSHAFIPKTKRKYAKLYIKTLEVIRLYPKEYVEYLVHFHGSRDYFECHEILEEYWKKTDTSNKQSIWVGFIQLAVSSYHHRRGNFAGAKKTLAKALQIFLLHEQQLSNLGLNPDALFALLGERIKQIDHHQPYESFKLPIEEPSLLSECKQLAKELRLDLEYRSDLKNKHLVHRHLLRDRTEVVQSRWRAIKQKRGGE